MKRFIGLIAIIVLTMFTTANAGFYGSAAEEDAFDAGRAAALNHETRDNNPHQGNDIEIMKIRAAWFDGFDDAQDD